MAKRLFGKKIIRENHHSGEKLFRKKLIREIIFRENVFEIISVRKGIIRKNVIREIDKLSGKCIRENAWEWRNLAVGLNVYLGIRGFLENKCATSAQDSKYQKTLTM